MSQYTTGKVTAVNSDATITGIGTLWLANITDGDWLVIPLANGGDGLAYQVASVTNDLSLELTAPYGGATIASEVAYAIHRDFTSNFNLPLLGRGDVGSDAIFTRAMEIIDTQIQVAADVGDLVVDKFTSPTDYVDDGSTAAILTLSIAPGSENNTWVFGSGGHIPHDAYTVVGTTLTITNGVAIGTSEINVMIGKTAPIGTPANESVTAAAMDATESQAIIDKLIANGGLLPVRDLLTNGNLKHWQRGTSFNLSGNAYTADRCFNVQSGTDEFNIDRVAATLSKNEFGLLMTRDNGGTNLNDIHVWSQSLETADSLHLAGEPVTFEGEVEVGAGFNGTLFCIINSGTGTDENVLTGFTGVVTVAFAEVTATGRFTVSGVIPSNATQVAFRLSYVPTTTGVANETIQVEDLVAVQGSAVPVMGTIKRSPQEELAECQRFYAENSYGAAVYNTLDVSGAGTTSIHMQTLPVKMRAAPTVTLINATGGGTVDQISDFDFRVLDASGVTTFNGWTADAEL